MNIYNTVKKLIFKIENIGLAGFFKVTRMVDHGGYIYVNIPKAGGNSVRAALHRCEALKDGMFDTDQKNIGNHRRTETGIDARPEGKLFLMHPKDTGNWSRFGNTIKNGIIFTFVRNPYSRAFSGYKEKIIQTYTMLEEFEKTSKNDQLLERRLKRRITRIKELGLDIKNKPSFEEFLKGLTKIPPKLADIHFAPQSYLMAIHAIPYDFIGRLEIYDEDMDRLSGLIFGKTDFWRKAESRDGGLRNVNYKGGGSKQNLLNESTETSIRLIKQYYADDFNYFGYSTDIENVDEAPPVILPTRAETEIPWRQLNIVGSSLSVGYNFDRFVRSLYS